MGTLLDKLNQIYDMPGLSPEEEEILRKFIKQLSQPKKILTSNCARDCKTRDNPVDLQTKLEEWNNFWKKVQNREIAQGRPDPNFMPYAHFHFFTKTLADLALPRIRKTTDPSELYTFHQAREKMETELLGGTLDVDFKKEILFFFCVYDDPALYFLHASWQDWYIENSVRVYRYRLVVDVGKVQKSLSYHSYV